MNSPHRPTRSLRKDYNAHIHQFYQIRKDLTDILVPYSRAGLESSVAEVRKAMKKAMPDFYHYLQKGHIYG